MLVSQFYNKNQFLIRVNNKVILQSYNSVVCVWDFQEKRLTLGDDWDYSNTTRKHVYLFINDYTDINLYSTTNKRKELQKLINRGDVDEENQTIIENIINQ